jgi:hypothetical protein
MWANGGSGQRVARPAEQGRWCKLGALTRAATAARQRVSDGCTYAVDTGDTTLVALGSCRDVIRSSMTVWLAASQIVTSRCVSLCTVKVPNPT